MALRNPLRTVGQLAKLWPERAPAMGGETAEVPADPGRRIRVLDSTTVAADPAAQILEGESVSVSASMSDESLQEHSEGGFADVMDVGLSLRQAAEFDIGNQIFAFPAEPDPLVDDTTIVDTSSPTSRGDTGKLVEAGSTIDFSAEDPERDDHAVRAHFLAQRRAADTTAKSGPYVFARLGEVSRPNTVRRTRKMDSTKAGTETGAKPGTKPDTDLKPDDVMASRAKLMTQYALAVQTSADTYFQFGRAEVRYAWQRVRDAQSLLQRESASFAKLRKVDERALNALREALELVDLREAECKRALATLHEARQIFDQTRRLI